MGATTNGHGVTEGGSSGSQFSQEKRIVGQLSGGGSICSNPDLLMNMESFQPVGLNGTLRVSIEPWLDPLSLNINLDGTYPPGGGQV